jgi:hypothetical protein
MKTNRLKKLAVIIVVAAMFLATGATIQAQEPPPDTPGAWHIYPGGSEHWVGNDRYSATWGSDLHNSIHEALGYSGQYLCPGPNNWDICYWEFYSPPPEGSIIELRGPGVWEIGGDGAQGGQGREKMKSLVVQQNGITIRGQDYDDGTGTMVQQELFFNNGATTALFYLEASNLTIENLHMRGTWPTNSSGYALAIGRYTMIGPDPNATGLTVTDNTFTNLRAMFDQRPTVANLAVENNLVEDTYYNIFKKGVTFTGDNTIDGNTFNNVGEGKNYPAIQILGNEGTICVDNNTFDGWKLGQYAIYVENDATTPVGVGENNTFVDQAAGTYAVFNDYMLSSGYAVGWEFDGDATGCAPPVIEVDIDIKPGSFPNSVNHRGKGKIPVAILSTADFDAPSDVGPDSLTFGPTGDEDSLAFCSPSPEDVDGDGLYDLVCHFFTQSAGFACGDEMGVLKGQTVDGVPMEGSDSVRILPCK